MPALRGMAMGAVAAATAAPVQALAALAISASAAGADPAPWCAALVALSALRAALSYAATRSTAAAAGAAEIMLLHHHGAAAVAGGMPAWRRLAEAIAARFEWRRAAAEAGGLAIGCAAVLAWVDPLLAVAWFLLHAILAWAAGAGGWAEDCADDLHATRLEAEGVRRGWRASAAWLAAIGLGGWAAGSARTQAEAVAERLHAAGGAQRHRQMLVLMGGGIIQSAAAAWAVALVAGGAVGAGAAVAAILATTTVASRSELLVQLAALDARRRRAESAVAGDPLGCGVEQAGIAVVVPDPAQPISSLVRHLDPCRCHRTHELTAVLARVGLDSGRLAGDPSTLSAGERFRLETARALLARPRVLLLVDPARHLGAAAADGLVHAIQSRPGAGETLIVATIPGMADDIARRDAA